MNNIKIIHQLGVHCSLRFNQISACTVDNSEAFFRAVSDPKEELDLERADHFELLWTAEYVDPAIKEIAGLLGKSIQQDCFIPGGSIREAKPEVNVPFGPSGLTQAHRPDSCSVDCAKSVFHFDQDTFTANMLW